MILDVDIHEDDYDINNNNNNNNSYYFRQLCVTKLIPIKLHDTVITLQILSLSEILRQNTNVSATGDAIGYHFKQYVLMKAIALTECLADTGINQMSVSVT
jgi:hypothetical protein